MILPDVVEAGLRAVFCGTAAGDESARARVYYAGPGNLFWPTLHEIGLTPRRLRPSEYQELAHYGLGLTDLCKVRSGSDRAVGTDAFDVDRLLQTLERHAPTWIGFNGKRAAEAVLDHKVDYGEQPERLGETRVFVLPSTAGTARGYWEVAHWRAFSRRVLGVSPG